MAGIFAGGGCGGVIGGAHSHDIVRFDNPTQCRVDPREQLLTGGFDIVGGDTMRIVDHKGADRRIALSDVGLAAKPEPLTGLEMLRKEINDWCGDALNH